MKKILFSILATSLLFFGLTTSALAYSATGQICGSAKTSSAPTSASVCQSSNGNNPISGSDGILTKVINVFTVIVGAISVIMIVIGGLLYVLSGGESARINTAKNTIVYAIVGVVIVLLGQAIIALVINRS